MRPYVQAGKHDFVIASNDAVEPSSAFSAAALYVHYLSVGGNGLVMECRYGRTAVEAVESIVALLEAEDSQANAMTRALNEGTKTRDDLRAAIEQRQDSSNEGFVPLSAEGHRLIDNYARAGLAAVIIGENHLLPPRSPRRFAAVFVDPLVGASSGSVMRFRSGATMDDAVEELVAALSQD